jgi:hypothetical protein
VVRIARGKERLKVNRNEVPEVQDCTALHRASLLFAPKAFAVEHPKLEGRIIEASTQWMSFDVFAKKPTRSMIYIVAGNPDDEKAKYFAAYLVQLHKQYVEAKGRVSQVIWEHVYNGYDNPLLKTGVEPSMLVLDNLTVKSNFVKLDKARDLLQRWSDIPRVVVCAGEDPISFAAQRLHVACHGLAYFASDISKTAQQVI